MLNPMKGSMARMVGAAVAVTAGRVVGGITSDSSRFMGTVSDKKEMYALKLDAIAPKVVFQLDNLTRVPVSELDRLSAVLDGDEVSRGDSRALQELVRDGAETVGDQMTQDVLGRIVYGYSNESLGGEIRINPMSEFHETQFDLLLTAQHEALHEMLSGVTTVPFNMMDFKTCTSDSEEFKAVSDKFIEHALGELASESPSDELNIKKEIFNKFVNHPEIRGYRHIQESFANILKSCSSEELTASIDAMRSAPYSDEFPIIDSVLVQEIATTTQQELTELFREKLVSGVPITESNVRATLEDNTVKFMKHYTDGLLSFGVDSSDRSAALELITNYSESLVSSLLTSGLVLPEEGGGRA